ncbi:MAG: LuxR C-terminal-related transcriptional regulator [Planctomycetaceae bacterium]
MPASSNRIVLIDNHPLFVEAMSQRINRLPGLEVAGTACDSDAGWNCVQEHQPDLVVLNLEIPGRGAFSVAEELVERFPSTRIIFWADYFSDVILDEVLRLNAGGFLLTSEPTERIIDAFRSVCQGETVYSDEIAARLEYDAEAGRFVAKFFNSLATLTIRELAVLRDLARGESVKDIAHTLALSDRAVESHKYRIMRRLGIHDRVELARYAIREGLAVP